MHGQECVKERLEGCIIISDNISIRINTLGVDI